MPTHLACVGDSITEGFGASSPAMYYPAQLQGLLGNSVQVKNFGHSGTTMLGPGYGDSPYVQTYEYTAATDFVSNAGANAVVSVIIMLGANDSKPSNWEPAGQPKNDQQYLTDYRRPLPRTPHEAERVRRVSNCDRQQSVLHHSR
ncbi:MAG TPA: GDSL-type esterase/lipase family protein [Polyangiaceae bacterium]|nr:GDSL-type esterase/lipase family protein [Polyangiaceae bacterium]